MIRSDGAADLRGGGSQSARLTYGLVTAASQLRGLLNQSGWRVDAHLHSVGDLHSKPLFLLDRKTELPEDSTMARLNCRDEQAAESFSFLLKKLDGPRFDRL